jgi:hypothetical protein
MITDWQLVGVGSTVVGHTHDNGKTGGATRGRTDVTKRQKEQGTAHMKLSLVGTP